MTTSKDFLARNLDLAIRTSKEAGALLLEGFNSEKTIETKSSSVDWVTEYDRASEELIVKALLTQNPDHGIMGEEGSRVEGASDYKWYVDPLDGTTNYAHRFPVFAVSIALYEGENPLLGVVYDPVREEAFTAIKGQGAKLLTPQGEQTLKVSATKELGRSLLATGFPYDRQTNDHNNLTEVAKFIRNAQGIRRPGSAAIDMVYVAAGRLDGYWEFRLYAWDMAAARLIAEEAGGRVSHPDGSPLVITEQLSFVVSNGHIHEQMLAVLADAAKDRADGASRE